MSFARCKTCHRFFTLPVRVGCWAEKDYICPRCQYDLDSKADEELRDQQHKRKQDKLDHDQDRVQDELDREHDRRRDELDQQHRRDMEKKRLELQAMDKRLKAMRLTMQWKLMDQDLEEERSLPYEKQDVAPSAPGLSE